MKSIEILEKYYQNLNSNKDSIVPKDSKDGKEESKKKQFKLTLAKKMDLLYDIYVYFKSCEKAELNLMKEKVKELAMKITTQGCGASISRMIYKIYEVLFLTVDRTKLLLFFEEQIAIILSPKVLYSQKISSLYLIGKTFQNFWGHMISAPTSELVLSIGKLIKTNNEWYIKESGLVALQKILKVKPSNLSPSLPESLKIITKNIQTAKTNEVKLQAGKCLKLFCKVLKGTEIMTHYDTIYSICIKGFEDFYKNYRTQLIHGFVNIVTNKFNEIYQEAEFNPIGKKRQSEPPRNFLDLFATLQPIFTKSQVDEEKESVIQSIILIMKKNKSFLLKTKPENIIKHALAYIFKNLGQEYENYKARILIWNLMKEYIDLLNDKEMIKLMDVLLTNLDELKDKLSFDGIEYRQKKAGFLSSKTSQQGIANEGQIIVMLSSLNTLFFSLGVKVAQYYQNVNHITDILVPFIATCASDLLRLYSCECIKTLGITCRSWLCQLLSLFLNITTITHAEIAAMKPAIIYYKNAGGLLTEEGMNLAAATNSLNGYCVCLSSLLVCLINTMKGIPLDIATAALMAAKGIIIGTYHNEEEEEQIPSKPHQTLSRKEGGWIILEGLIGLGYAWVASCLQTFFKLWNLTFDKESCSIHVKKLNQPEYCERILSEFKTKKYALSSLRAFIHKCNPLITTQLLKYLSTFLINCLQFLIPLKCEEVTALFTNNFPIEYRQMRGDLFECFSLIPTSMYHQAFLQLLPSVSEEITGIHSSISPTLWHKWLSKEDNQLTTKDIMGLEEKQFNFSILMKECFEEEPYIQLLRLDKVFLDSYSEDTNSYLKIINSCVQLFCQIFISSNLHSKNRIQLMKHLLAHVTHISQNKNSLTKKENKDVLYGNYNKVLSIALCILGIARAVLKKVRSSSTANLNPLLMDETIFLQLLEVLQNCNLITETLVKRVCCEATVLLYKAFYPDNSSKLDQFVSKIETDFASKDMLQRINSAFIAANMIRHFEWQSILPYMQTLGHILQKLCRETNNFSKIYSLHFIFLSFKHSASKFYDILKVTYPLCYHNYHTDIRTEKNVFASISCISDLFLKTGLLEKTTNEDNKKRWEIIYQDNINVQNSKYKLILFSALNMLKSSVFFQKIHDFKGIFQKVRTLFLNYEELDTKTACLEIFATFIYKDYFSMIMKEDENFMWELINELNTLLCTNRHYNQKKVKKQLKLQLEMNAEASYSKLININYKSEDINKAKIRELQFNNVVLIYKANLKQLIWNVMKIYSKDLEKLINLMRQFFSYQFKTAIEIEELKSPVLIKSDKGEKTEKGEGREKDKNAIVIAKTEEKVYHFNKPVNIKSKIFMLKCLSSFIKLLPSHHQHQHPHSSPSVSEFKSPWNKDKSSALKKQDSSLLVPYLNTILTLAFNNISSDDTSLKLYGFKIILALINKFHNTPDISAPLEAQNQDDLNLSASSQEDEPESVVILQQFEAQIYTLIRQNLSKYNAYPILNIVFKICYYFITIPITRDQQTIEKILSLLTQNLHELSVSSSTEFYCEKVALESHMKRLRFLCELYLTSINIDNFQTYEIVKPEINSSQKQIEKERNLIQNRFLSFEDRKRIHELFTPEIIENMFRQIRCLLKDGYIVLTQERRKIKTYSSFIFIHSGTNCAYHNSLFDTNTQLFLKLISLCGVYPHSNKDKNEERKTQEIKDPSTENIPNIWEFCLEIIFFYLSKGIYSGEEKESEGINLQLYFVNNIKIKQIMLDNLQDFLNLEIQHISNTEILEILSLLNKLLDMKMQELEGKIINIVNIIMKKTTIESSQSELEEKVSMDLIMEMGRIVVKIMERLLRGERELKEEEKGDEEVVDSELEEGIKPVPLNAGLELEFDEEQKQIEEEKKEEIKDEEQKEKPVSPKNTSKEQTPQQKQLHQNKRDKTILELSEQNLQVLAQSCNAWNNLLLNSIIPLFKNTNNHTLHKYFIDTLHTILISLFSFMPRSSTPLATFFTKFFSSLTTQLIKTLNTNTNTTQPNPDNTNNKQIDQLLNYNQILINALDKFIQALQNQITSASPPMIDYFVIILLNLCIQITFQQADDQLTQGFNSICQLYYNPKFTQTFVKNTMLLLKQGQTTEKPFLIQLFKANFNYFHKFLSNKEEDEDFIAQIPLLIKLNFTIFASNQKLLQNLDIFKMIFGVLVNFALPPSHYQNLSLVANKSFFDGNTKDLTIVQITSICLLNEMIRLNPVLFKQVVQSMQQQEALFLQSLLKATLQKETKPPSQPESSSKETEIKSKPEPEPQKEVKTPAQKSNQDSGITLKMTFKK